MAQAADPVQIYSEQGHLVASFGRSGEGPAEFMRVDAVWQGHGDTIWVGEAVRGRTVAFSHAGDFLLSVPLAAVVRGFQWTVVGPAAGDGLILEEATAGQPDSRGISESRGKVWYRYDQATGELTRLAEGVARELYVHSWSGSVAEGEIIFGGRSHAWVWGTGIGLAPAGHELQAIRLDSEATPVARFGNGYLAPSATREDRQQYVTWRLLNAPGNADTAAWRSALEQSPERDRFPAVAAGIVDSEGSLWIRQYSPPFEADAVWSVFGPDGTWFGQIALPNNLTVTEIGPDFIVGFARDELKVETVVVLELRRFQ